MCVNTRTRGTCIGSVRVFYTTESRRTVFRGKLHAAAVHFCKVFRLESSPKRL